MVVNIMLHVILIKDLILLLKLINRIILYFNLFLRDNLQLKLVNKFLNLRLVKMRVDFGNRDVKDMNNRLEK